MRGSKLGKAICCLVLGILFLISMPQPVAAQNVVTGSFTISLTISNLSVSDIGDGSAVVTWDTNGDATSQVYYDIVPHEYIDDYLYHSTLNSNLVTHHFVTLTGLSSGTTYYFRVNSQPEGGSEPGAISQESTFGTTGAVSTAMKDFSINSLFIYWAPHIPRRQGNDSFTIFGRLQLPQGYTVADLQKQATVNITIAGKSGNDEVLFKERTVGQPQSTMWLYKGHEQPPGVSMNITSMTMWWAPQGSPWAGWAGFSIGGVLQLPSEIGVNTKPTNVELTIEIPITTAAGGSLIGEQNVTHHIYKLINLWVYTTSSNLVFPYDTMGKAYQDALALASIDHYSVSNISSPQIAGRTFNLTIQAQDEDNNNIDIGSEVVNITLAKVDTGTTPLSTSTTNGAAKVSMTMAKVQAGQTITFTGDTSGKSGTSNSFNVNVGAIPRVPTLKSPTDDLKLSNLAPTLVWNASTGATSYGLQISTKSNFTSLVVNQTGITNTYYFMLSGKLVGNTTYYWRVNASNDSGTSIWSKYWQFKTPYGH
jgi:hypothetical protein